MARSPLVERPDTEIPVATEAAVEAAGDAEARVEAGNRFKSMASYLAKQPKVKIRPPEDVVITLNGYTVYIKGKVTVEIPSPMADIYFQAQDAGRF